MRARWSLAAAVAVPLAGCGGAPQSQFPTVRDAIQRMRATTECSRAVSGEARIVYYGDQGRVRGKVLFMAARPESLRFDVQSPLGGTLISSLTSNGRDFALNDVGNKVFWHGPANTCNVQRFTRVPVPPHALAPMMIGEAPVLVHQPADATIEWSSGFFGGGNYVISIASKHGAKQEIRLVPHPNDFDKPWQQQRVRVIGVKVTQQGYELYEAELGDHGRAPMSTPRVDPEGISPDVPPSGPECRAEVPRSLYLNAPGSDQELQLRYTEVKHNPPLIESAFRLDVPGGVAVRYSSCE